MKRFYITGILAIALLVVAAACGGDDDTPTAVPRATSVPVPTSTPVPEPEGVAGGTLKLGLYRSFPGLLIWENTVFDVAQLVLPATNGLVGTDPEQSEPVIVSELAETWSLENDTTAVFNLRRGVTFHDGVGFTCAHAKWSVDTIRTGDGMDKSPRKPLFANVASVECRDDYTLVLNLSQPYAPLIPVLSMGWNQILPKHVADLNGLEFFRTEGLIGTGPFKVDHVVPGEEYRASRYDNYWNDPFPYLDGIELLKFADVAAANAALRVGQIHVALVQTFAAKELQDQAADLVFQKLPGWDWENYQVNHTKALFNDKRIKDAISLAMDRQGHISVGTKGFGTVGGILPPASAYAFNQSKLNTYAGYDTSDLEANRQRARDLLQEAGYGPGELELDIIVAPINATTLPLFLDSLEKVGIKPTVVPVGSYPVFYELAGELNFDIMYAVFGLAHDDPNIIIEEHYTCDASRNYAKFCNSSTDDLMNQASAATDFAARKRLIDQVQETLMSDHAKDVIQWWDRVYAHTKDLQGFVGGPDGGFNASWHLERVWFRR